jgi:hypothetical protein
MALNNLSSVGIPQTVESVNTPLRRYPLSPKAAVGSRLQRSDVLRATRDYEASLKLGSGAAARQMQMKAFAKVQKLGGKASAPLTGANSFRSQSLGRGSFGNQPSNLNRGLFK